MDREILFRGKQENNDEWCTGLLVKTDKGNTLIINTAEELGCGICMEIFDRYKNYEVSPETVGQFTGLIDKNGNKVFEGDIIKYQINIKTAIVGKIVFLCGAFVFESEELERECDIAFATFADDVISFSQHCIEIIGNIHDNPEFLKGE